MKKLIYLLFFLPSLSWADAKVSALTETLFPKATDYLYIVAQSTSMKVQVGTVLNSATSYLSLLSSTQTWTGGNTYSSFTNFTGSSTFSSTVNVSSISSIGTITSTSIATLPNIDTPINFRTGGAARLTLTLDGTNSTMAIGLGNNLVFTGPTGTSMTFGATSITATRNTADANPAFTINNANASATGNILNLSFNSGVVASIDNTGIYRGSAVANASSANNSRLSLLTSGSTISRNIADANPNLILNQSNASSTGDILQAQMAGVTNFAIGIATATSSVPFYAKASTTNVAAAPLYWGEFISSATQVYSNMAATTIYSDIVSKALTPGDWRCFGQIDINTTGVTLTQVFGAVSLYSGNITTDHVQNVNVSPAFGVGTIADMVGPIPMSQFLVSTSTTVFLKATATYTLGTPQQRGVLNCLGGH